MNQPPQVKSEFHGTEAECLQQAAADAERAAQNGYAPISQLWSDDAAGRVLTVIYQLQTPAAVPAVVPAWTAGAGPAPAAYPVGLTIDESGGINRLWGIPLVGLWLRTFILIPHFVVLALYGILVSLSFLLTWIPVLVLGRYPQWGYALVGGFVRWSTRVSSYVLLMAIPYPPFTTGAGFAVEVAYDRDQHINRLWGIPLIGFMVRALALIPHFIALWLVGILAGFISFFVWIPILIYGRYPALAYQIVGGYLRWGIRVSSWLFLMVGPYPPFRLSQ